MCGRYVTEEDTSPEMQAVYRAVRAAYPDISLKSGEIFPTDTVPLILDGGQGRGLCLYPASWGFPAATGKGMLINARAETAAVKDTFRDCFLHGRCIIPTNGYYEWSGDKQKYRFNLPGRRTVYLAGLYRAAPEGLRFVVLTTAANESVLPVHHRMPVVLLPDALGRWAQDVGYATQYLRAAMPAMTQLLVG